MSYLVLKSAHILSMALLFGTGLGSAWYKWLADRGGNPVHILATNQNVVLADWVFTTPTIIVQPVTGITIAMMADIPLTTPWLAASFALYALAGICWIPVVVLQIKMKNLAKAACAAQAPLPEVYWRYARCWFWLGIPAFSAMVLIVFLMVFKPA